MAAVLSSSLMATTETFWANAVVAEVYTPGLFFTLAVFALLERAHTVQKPKYLSAAGLIAGLGVGMHMSIATLGLGYAWLVATYDLEFRKIGDLRKLGEQPRERLKRMLKAAGSTILGLLVFLYIPVRSFENWDASEWTVFYKNAMGGTFKRKFLDGYDVFDRAQLVFQIFADNILPVGIVVAGVGCIALLRTRPKIGVGLLLGVAGNGWWFFNYSVPDLDVFYLPTIAIACVFFGVGVKTVSESLARYAARWRYVAGLGSALPAALVLRNYSAVDLSSATEASEYGKRICENAGEGGRAVLYSSPTEWRYYSVFLYEQLAFERCENIEIWRNPKLSALSLAVARGETIYLFHRVTNVAGSFDVVDTGGLLRLERRKKKHKPRKHRRSPLLP